MKTGFPLIVLLIVAMTACKPANTGDNMQNQTNEPQHQATTESSPQPAPTAADGSSSQATATSVDCPTPIFSEFVPLFLDDENFQRKHTGFPLTWMYLKDEDHSEIVESLDEKQVRFPLVHTFSTFDESGLSWAVESADDKKAEIRVWQEGTGSLTHYFFENDGCWKLVRVDDWSV